MRGKSRRFFGLSTGSLPTNFNPKISVYRDEPVSRSRSSRPRRPEPLTPAEWKLIDQHLNFYLCLAQGTRGPDSAAQRHFVAVCRGAAHPETPHEVAFL